MEKQLEKLVHYQSREYCKASGCETRKLLTDMSDLEGTPEYESIRATCQSSCKKTAHDFQEWLMRQGYSIVREKK